ncbi:hypothetical protein J4229_02910 [Candidatus Pacearchaeota archaeon]|nr:hypothetical protein [Candidatus Pacearchaeota archaeon]
MDFRKNGINPGIVEGPDKFPYLNVPEIGDINSIDAVILSHAHLDHCLPPHSLVLTEEGYKRIDDVQVGENMISMDWKTGDYIKSKCTEKTKTTGHKKVLTIKTPYSEVESSPNHRFFTFENMQLKELEALELKKGVLLPSNIFHKPIISQRKIILDTKVDYDKRRKDTIILPKELTPELSEFIGYYMGDGHKSSEFSLRLTDASTQILEHHKMLINKLFNFNAVIRHHSDKTKNAHILEINNVKIIRFLEQNFPEMMLGTKEIRAPQKIICGSLENQRAYIRGIADADGTVTNVIKITSFSENMLKDLRYLFSLQEIPSNITSDNSICLNSKFSINKYGEKIGFSLDYKAENLRRLLKQYSSFEFNHQDLMPLTSLDLRKILKEAGFVGRVHNSPNLKNLLPMCLLDLYRRGKGYATRKTVIELVELLNQRIVELRNIKDNSQLYALRQLLSLTRQEISIATGLKVSQVQQVEENRISEQFAIKIAPILAVFMQERLSSIISQTVNNIHLIQNLLRLNLTWERIVNIKQRDGLIPYLYKMGYKGPLYLTAPTRDVAALLALDFIEVAYKQAVSPLFKSDDIREMVKHTICLDFGEVTDITKDMRITLYNAGHVLGSSEVHINIGNGLHNFVYTGDMKYLKTRLLDPAVNYFPRVETLLIESTYGSKNDVLPPRQDAENKFIELARATIERKGKILLPELGLGHAQEAVLSVEEAVRMGKLPKVPVYLDGMIWDINAIHTAYPDFLSSSVRNQIYQDNNPFVSDVIKRVGSPTERKEVLEGGPCIIIATSGMLVGGASLEYFKSLADNPNNLIVFECYQAAGSLGRQVQEGAKELFLGQDYGAEKLNIRLQVETLSGLSAHSGRNELMQYISRMNPKPKKIIINHGEASKCLDFASSLYRLHNVETNVPKNLETIRLK